MKRAAGVLAAALALTPLRLGSAAELTLADAVRLAGERQVSVLVSNERVLRALDRVKEARGGLLPDIKATASETRRTANLEAQGINIPSMNPRVGPYNVFDARLSLIQPLFDAAAYERFRQARVGEALSRAAYAKARNDAMALVAGLYLEARRAQEAVALAEARARREEAVERVAKAALSLGTGEEIAARQAASEAEAARAGLSAARASADARRRDLAAALGLDEELPVAFSSAALAEVAAPGSLDELLEEHPDLQAVRRQAASDKGVRAVERADRLPQAAVAADYGPSGRSPSDSFPTYSLGVRLSVPLTDGGRRAARGREAESQVKESELQLADARRRLKAEAESARQDEAQAAEAARSAESAAAVAEKRLALARERLGRGSGSQLEVEDAAASAAAAEDARRGAASARDMALVRLAKALGKMDLLAGRS